MAHLVALIAGKDGLYRPGSMKKGGNGRVSRAMSAPVNTVTTPGALFAAATSMLLMRAWASGLTKKRRVENPRRVDVSDVAAPTREEPVVLDPCDALADESRQARWGVHDPAPSDVAARSRTAISTPSMIN